MAEGFIQLSPDSTAQGKQLDSDVVQIPAGTVITNLDGTTTTLTAPAYYYRERLVIADPNDPRGTATVTTGLVGPSGQDYGLTVRLPPGQSDLAAMIALLQDIDLQLSTLTGIVPQSGIQVPQQQMNAIRQHSLPAPVLSSSVPLPVMADRFGRLITVPVGTRATTNANSVTITSTAETNIYPADGFNYSDLVAIVVSNTSATAVRVDIRDQPSTVISPASSVGVIPIYVPAGDMRGISFNIPNYQSNLNQPWTATVSSAVTDIRIWSYFAQSRAT